MWMRLGAGWDKRGTRVPQPVTEAEKHGQLRVAFFSLLVLLRYNQHTAPCKFKVSSKMLTDITK